MSAIYLDQITPVWNNFSKFVHVLHNEQDYEQAVELLNSLLTGLKRLWAIKNTTRYVFSDLLL